MVNSGRPTDVRNPGATPGVLRHSEAMKYIDTIDDAVTKRLVHRAQFFALRRFAERKDRPKADFDFLFFAHVMKDFCEQHDVLREVLGGKDDGGWWGDE